MNNKITFGRKIQELRRAKNWSQRDLAKKVEIDFTYISKIENGKMPPPRKDVIERFAKILGADLNELLSLTGEFPEALKEKINNSEAVRQFIYRYALNLSEKDWEKIVANIEKEKVK